ncbi:MAG: gliding motility-associated C-terminal domain-containing protein, partial [Flavobacteriales bacterium]|nr:gliding motility-associated C-terminal domain-containing protein [Flavobacteriales bacterium]
LASNVYNAIGSYDVTLTVWAGPCMDDSMITINVYESPIADFIRDSACATDTIRYTDSSHFIPDPVTSFIEFWDWDFGDGIGLATDTNPAYDFPNPGTFITTLIVTTNFGCTDTMLDTVTIFPKPQADFTWTPDSGTILNAFISFFDETISDSLTTWDWSFGDTATSAIPNPTHEYLDTGFYPVRLVVTDTNGCMDTVSHTIRILPDYTIFIPNSFTPNGDGFNEVFHPKGKGINEKGYQFYLYNRWGDEIWGTSNFLEPWDGTVNKGDPAPTGVYVWLIISRDLTGRSHTYTGHVSLIR